MDEFDRIVDKFLNLIQYKISRIDGCSIRKVAKDLDISYGTLQSNLSRNSAMSLITAIKLAHYFDVDLNALILTDKNYLELVNTFADMDAIQKQTALNLIKSFAEYVNINKNK